MWLTDYYVDDPTPHFFPFTHEYSAKEFLQCGLASRVTVVDGKMVLIDRERKMIALQNSSTVLRYDYLIITTGLQVGEYKPIMNAVNQLQENTGNHLTVELANRSEQVLRENGVNGNHSASTERVKSDKGIPTASGVAGFVSLGTRQQISLLRERLSIRGEGEPVLVYGTCLEAFSAVQGNSRWHFLVFQTEVWCRVVRDRTRRKVNNCRLITRGPQLQSS